jgi:hypothetical protein
VANRDGDEVGGERLDEFRIAGRCSRVERHHTREPCQVVGADGRSRDRCQIDRLAPAGAGIAGGRGTHRRPSALRACFSQAVSGAWSAAIVDPAPVDLPVSADGGTGSSFSWVVLVPHS